MSGPQRSVPAPARPAPPAPSKPTRARRRPALVALGLALVALSVLASVYLTSSLGETRKVLAVTNPVGRGEVIETGDLALVDLPTGPTILRAVDADLLSSIAGRQRAQTELLPGQLLTEGSFAERVGPAPDKAIVGVALAPHQLPTLDLHSGDRVRIVETPVSGGEPPVEAPASFPATVVGTAPTELDQVVVDVEVARADAPAIAARAATGRVALVLESPGGEGAGAGEADGAGTGNGDGDG